MLRRDRESQTRRRFKMQLQALSTLDSVEEEMEQPCFDELQICHVRGNDLKKK